MEKSNVRDCNWMFKEISKQHVEELIFNCFLNNVNFDEMYETILSAPSAEIIEVDFKAKKRIN
jgi:hypothetical protein